jgi:hypothetical protein
MSALPPITDIRQRIERVCFVPTADIHVGASTHLQSAFSVAFKARFPAAMGHQEFAIVLSVRCSRHLQRVGDQSRSLRQGYRAKERRLRSPQADQVAQSAALSGRHTQRFHAGIDRVIRKEMVGEIFHASHLTLGGRFPYRWRGGSRHIRASECIGSCGGLV